MTATSAAADPLPPFYLGANYAPTSKEDEALVLQALRTCINKKPHPTWYGTKRTVATPVGKFPSHPHNNRRHDDKRHHKPNRLAAAAIVTATATAPTPTTLTPSPSHSYPKDAIARAFAQLQADIFLILQLPRPTTTHPVLPLNQPTSLPTHTTKRPPTSHTVSRQQPVERN